MSRRERMSGNEAIAYAMKQIDPDVMGTYPITPSTEIPQYFSSYVANGQVQTEFVPVESEHSAMSTCIGASAAGARAITATSSAGFALMWELLYVAASDRLPIVMAVVNRALTGPININCDHSDSMGARDAGWIQIYSENNQEAYDNYIQAFPIAERCRLPIMICQDGFITSHDVENITLYDDKDVKAFVGEYEPEHYLLKKGETMAVGPYGVSNYYMEIKKAQAEAMKHAHDVVLEVGAEFSKAFGKDYDLIERYMMDDAEYAVVVIGSSAGTGKAAVNMLREQGVKAGLVKIRVFRPFPKQELYDALTGVKAVAAMDKSEGMSGCGGPVFAETRSALYDSPERPLMIDYVYGLGGRDVTIKTFTDIFGELQKAAETGDTGDVYRHIGVRDNGESGDECITGRGTGSDAAVQEAAEK
ncbi:MAG: pyruvate ferredoxin oxidoreductase [Eubacterium sp.]|nr:pyruvate ferredoxin oxidoreductase [Eubacterium sp.]